MNTGTHRQAPHKRGFTLIEMLIVIVIILILSGMLLKIMGLVGRKTGAARAHYDLEQLQNAINEFYAEYGHYPPTSGLAYEYEASYKYTQPQWFRPIFVGTGIWQEAGFGSIVFLAAIAGVSPSLYESAVVDGANRWQMMWKITIPSILPTIAILFILRFATVLKAGWDQIYLLRMPGNITKSQILDTYIIEIGLEGGQFGNATAVTLFQSVIGLILVLIVNKIAKKTTEVGLF